MVPVIGEGEFYLVLKKRSYLDRPPWLEEWILWCHTFDFIVGGKKKGTTSLDGLNNKKRVVFFKRGTERIKKFGRERKWEVGGENSEEKRGVCLCVSLATH